MTIEYEVRTAAGTVTFTSPDRKLAIRHATASADRMPGLQVFEIITAEPSVRRIWTEARLRIRVVA